MAPKSPFQSKTIILNSVMAILMGLSAFMPGSNTVLAFLRDHGAEIATIWSILSIGLRMVTNGKITLVD